MALLGQADVIAPLPCIGREIIGAIESWRVTGRGGAAFPTATKWRAVAEHSRGDAVIVVNGAEGEPRSHKDRTLMTARPHLVLDGAFIAARALKARRIVLYIGERHTAARDSMLRALALRTEHESRTVGVASAPARYVAGAESAAVHFINEGIATPATVPPYPFVRGVDAAPTLVQNVETLANVAILARTGQLPGTLLLTAAGAVAKPGVVEVESGTTVADFVARTGGATEAPRAVLIGGYFGRWMTASEAWALRLTESTGIGCGVIGVLPQSRCPVCETAGIMRYLASESSAQCGPCFFGLRALADACTRIASDGSKTADVERLKRWATEVRGRGACRHPDGAAIFLSSALAVFEQEFEHHRPHDLRPAA